MENKEHRFGKTGKRLAAAVAAGAFLGIVLADGKVVEPFDRPDKDCAIELRSDIPAIQQGYEVAILNLHAHTSTGTPYNYTAHTGIDDHGVFYKV